MRATSYSMAVTTAVLMLAGCAAKAPETRTVQGECVDLYGGNVCTWATLGAGDKVVAYGATVPVASIQGAPADMEMVWPPVANGVARLPAEVTAATGVDHLTIYWEAHGHPPGPYLTPHFDFHFYGIAGAAREAIDCADPAKPSALPAGYSLPDIEIPGLGMLPGLCVPSMGMHALLASEMESTGLFSGTMVIGYYQASPVFFEPMIAREMLLKRESFELPMPAVPGLPEGVRYPGRFRADYDATTEAYRFTFSGL